MRLLLVWERTERIFMVLCTIFDSNYLDKGLVMLKSLQKCSPESRVYVLAFDERAEFILKKINLYNVSVVGLHQVESQQIAALKESRSKEEYVWTFTPIFIEYVMDTFETEYCTYIDADMFFYSNPQVLFDELIQAKKSVGVMEHRFRNTANGRKLLENGKYCVEFNTFKNDNEGRKLLSLWKNLCIHECSLGNTIGDQGYISSWGTDYPDIVHEYQNFGGGVAPWNFSRYRIVYRNNRLFVREQGCMRELIFYHFQGIAYQGNDKVKMGIIGLDNGFVPRKYIREIYYPYLYNLEVAQEYLKRYFNLDIINRGRIEFTYIKFDLKKFLKSVKYRMSKGEYLETLDLIARVLRKKQDIVILRSRDRL